MKTFQGQHYRNRFPLYSRIRIDDNSVGAKILNVIGDEFKLTELLIKRFSKQTKCLEEMPVFMPSVRYVFNFNADSYKITNSTPSESTSNYYNAYKNSLSRYEIDNLLVLNCIANSGITVKESRVLEDSFLLPPTRISNLRIESEPNKNPLICELNLETIKYLNEFISPNGEHLYIEIPRVFNNQSIKYYTSGYEVPIYQDYSHIILRGYDYNNKPIEEHIPLNLNVFYRTKRRFMKLSNLSMDSYNGIMGGPAVECDGFKGLVRIYSYPCFKKSKMNYESIELVANNFYLNDLFSTYYSACRIDIESNKLKYYFDNYNNANKEQYNYLYNANLQSIDFDLIHKLFLEQSLSLDAEENILSFDYDYFTNHLVCLTDKGKLKYYSIEFTDFVTPEIRRTKAISLEIENTLQRITLDSDPAKNQYELHLFDRHYVYKVSTMLIFRRTPTLKLNQQTFKLEFLNDLGQWSESLYRFDNLEYYSNLSGNEDFNNLVNTSYINNFKIPVTFDSEGQYDFYVLSAHYLNNNYNVFNEMLNAYTPDKLIKFINDNLDKQDLREEDSSIVFELNYHSVLVDKLSTAGTFDLTLLDANWITDNQNKELFISFENVNNSLKIYVKNDTNILEKIYTFDQHFDYLIHDNNTGRCIFLEEYSSIDITFNTNSNKSVTLRY